MITSIVYYVPPSVELLGLTTPQNKTRIHDAPSFQTRLTPLSAFIFMVNIPLLLP